MSEQTASKVPQIRFKGYEGEWAEATVSDFVLSLDAGVSVNSGDRTANSVEFGILKTSAVTNGVFEADENKVVLIESEQSRLKESVSGGTIIISRMNTPALVGANAYVESNHENLFLPDRLWAAKPRDGASMRFLASILGSEKGRDTLSKLAKGTSGSMKNITKPDVLAVSVMAPSPPEQTQIGKHFRALDSLIGLHQRKHDKLVTLKKAMLQKMFPQPGTTTPEIRFKGFSEEWAKGKLGSISESYSGGTPSVGNRSFYGGDIPFIRSAEINATSTELAITELGLRNSSAKMVSKGNVLYALYGATSGEVGISQINGAINQAILAITPHPGYSSEFLAIWLRNKKTFIVGTYIQGGQGNLSGNIVKSLEVDLPSSDEQQKIGTYFRTLDELISQHATQLQKLQQIKSACLEKMFV